MYNLLYNVFYTKNLHKILHKNQLKGSGDDSSSKIVSQRTPLNILEAYAKRCKIPVEYEYTSDCSHRHKSNVYVIRGNLAGFAGNILRKYLTNSFDASKLKNCFM